MKETLHQLHRRAALHRPSPAAVVPTTFAAALPTFSLPATSTSLSTAAGFTPPLPPVWRRVSSRGATYRVVSVEQQIQPFSAQAALPSSHKSAFPAHRFRPASQPNQDTVYSLAGEKRRLRERICRQIPAFVVEWRERAPKQKEIWKTVSRTNTPAACALAAQADWCAFGREFLREPGPAAPITENKSPNSALACAFNSARFSSSDILCDFSGDVGKSTADSERLNKNKTTQKTQFKKKPKPPQPPIPSEVSIDTWSGVCISDLGDQIG
jgi:hypothetical protein